MQISEVLLESLRRGFFLILAEVLYPPTLFFPWHPQICLKLQQCVWTTRSGFSNPLVQAPGASKEDTWSVSSWFSRFDCGAHRTWAYQEMYTVKNILTVLSSEPQS